MTTGPAQKTGDIHVRNLGRTDYLKFPAAAGMRCTSHSRYGEIRRWCTTSRERAIRIFPGYVGNLSQRPMQRKLMHMDGVIKLSGARGRLPNRSANKRSYGETLLDVAFVILVAKRVSRLETCVSKSAATVRYDSRKNRCREPDKTSPINILRAFLRFGSCRGGWPVVFVRGWVSSDLVSGQVRVITGVMRYLRAAVNGAHIFTN